MIFALIPLLGYFLQDRKIHFKEAIVLGFAQGITFYLILLYWVANLIPESSARMPWLLIPALVLLVLYLSCYTALFSVVLSFLVGRFGRAAVFAAPGLWSLLEIARSRGELGFSWGLTSSSLAINPVSVQGVSFYGPFGLSLILVLVNVLLAFVILGKSTRQRLFALSVAAAITGCHLVWGTIEIDRIEKKLEGCGDRPDVAIVQPNLDLGEKWDIAYRDTIFSQIEQLTMYAADKGVGLVIFPETAAPVSISYAPHYRMWLKRISREAGVDLLIGYVDHKHEKDESHAFNSAGLFDSGGNHSAQYEKINLLPFGEKIPWSQYIPVFSRLEFGQANFSPGKVPTLFRSGKGRFGVLICFESTFSEYTRDYVLNGADFLVNITNDGWFGSRRGAIQHAELAILRAVENRVTFLRAANTGISMLVDPTGRVRERIGMDVGGIIVGPIFPAVEKSIYRRYGHLTFFIMALISIVSAPLVYFSRR